MRRVMISAAAFLALAACVSSGTKVTPEQIAQFQKGQTTEAEVIAKLGVPNTTTMLPDGRKMDMYIYTHAQANAASFIPVVGLMAGGASSNSNSAIFYFDTAGIMTGSSGSSSHNEVATGLANQK